MENMRMYHSTILKFINSKIFLLLFICHLSSFILHSQENFLGHQIHFAPSKSPDSQYSEKDYRDLLREKYSGKKSKAAELQEFIDWLASGKRSYVNSNFQYTSLDSATNYLNKITELICKDEKVKYKIRIVRDPSINACAFEDGTIYVNVGLLASLNNEAEIAAVIGHELGHIIHQHAFKHYKVYKKYRRDMYYRRRNADYVYAFVQSKQASNKLIKMEEQGDEMAVTLLNSSKYDNKSLVAVEKVLDKVQKKAAAHGSGRSGINLIYLQTHPSAKKRVKRMEKVIQNNGKNFLVDSVYFQRLRSLATDECINELFTGQSYEACTELAFKKHLLNPNDAFYLFYLTESIRRLIALDSNWSKELFIAGNYKNSFQLDDTLRKDTAVAFFENKYIRLNYRDLPSIMLQLRGSILELTEEEIKKNSSFPLLRQDTIEFMTYSGALDYFRGVNERKGYKLNNLMLNEDCPVTTLNSREKRFYDLKCNKIPFNENTRAEQLFFLGDIDHVKGDHKAFSQGLSMEHSTGDQVYEHLKKADKEGKISFGEEMDFDDLNLLRDQMYLIKGFFKDVKIKTGPKNIFNVSLEDFKTRKSENFNVRAICPELLALAKKYGIKGIMLSDIAINEEQQKTVISSTHSQRWFIVHYYIDIFTNTVKFYSNASCYSQQGSMLGSDISPMFLGSNAGLAQTADPKQCFYESIFDAINN
jgi:hypothetical protein